MTFIIFVIFLPEAKVDASPDGEADEPEPEEDVDLLVDDVDRQDAQPVVVHDRSRRPVLVEGALGHLGEDLGHRVHPLLHVLAG